MSTVMIYHANPLHFSKDTPLFIYRYICITFKLMLNLITKVQQNGDRLTDLGSGHMSGINTQKHWTHFPVLGIETSSFQVRRNRLGAF